MAYDFTDKRAERLYYRASAKGHYTAFAWREDPARRESHWKKVIRIKTEEQIEALMKKIFLAAEAQERYRKAQQKSGVKLWRPKGIAVWIKAGSWGDDIGSHSELKIKAEPKKCRKCGIRNIVLAPYKLCTECYDEVTIGVKV